MVEVTLSVSLGVVKVRGWTTKATIGEYFSY